MSFHVSWHCVTNSCAPGPDWQSPRGSVRTFRPSPVDLAQPWSLSFEESLRALERLERLFIEPDGALVWRPGADEQLDGQCYDRAGRMLYVDLRGNVSGANIDRLKSAIDPSGDSLLVQLTQEGVFIAWLDWRTHWFPSRDAQS